MSFQATLIKWYQKNKRELPFRDTVDAYKIWLSEVILQQTRVEQGLPYYQKFIMHYPDVFALASASEDEVLKLWQGLGYYSRGRNLLATAREVVKKYNGVFPDEYHELLQLKGVGPYTAAAIASFAYGRKVYVVDGNVSRVLSRLFEVKVAINTSQGKNIIELLAEENGDKKHSALYNYAMMELGALVCTPANPACDVCPVSEYCLAYAHHTQKLLPHKIRNRKITHRWFYYLMIIHNDSIYIQQRCENDIWKSLYEFPLIESKKVISKNQLQKQLMEFDITEFEISKPYFHQLTHQKIEARFLIAILKRKLKKNITKNFLEVSMDEFQKKYAHPRLIEKFLNDFLKQHQ